MCEGTVLPLLPVLPVCEGTVPPLLGLPVAPAAPTAKFSCPPQVAEHRVKLQELESLIANLGTGDETVTDQAFEDRLKEAEREVTDLLREAQEVKGIHITLSDLIHF